MPLHFLQTEQCLNILLTVSTAEKLDHNSLWGFIYISFGDSLLFHCIFSPSAVPRITKYKLKVTAADDASSTLSGRHIPCHQQSVTCHSTGCNLYIFIPRGERETEQCTGRKWCVIDTTTSAGKSKITCNSGFPSLCRNRSVGSHQVYIG